MCIHAIVTGRVFLILILILFLILSLFLFLFLRRGQRGRVFRNARKRGWGQRTGDIGGTQEL